MSHCCVGALIIVVVGRQELGPQMANDPIERLDVDKAMAKVVECRELAKRARLPEHRIILEDMATTRETLSQSLDKGR